MNSFSKRANLKLLLTILIVPLTLIIHPTDINASKAAGIISFQAFIPLTPGASSTVHVKGRGDIDITTVVCLGAGTLTASLTKDDTEKDMVSMHLIGISADPPFIPNVAVTPATISVSTDMGNFGMVFILSANSEGNV